MVLLTIGIIILGLAGIGSSFFWQKSIEKEIESGNERMEELQRMMEWQFEQAKRQDELSKTLITFIDKNIKERVVYTTKDMGYDNINKADMVIGEEEEPVIEEDVQELNAEQLDSAITKEEK